MKRRPSFTMFLCALAASVLSLSAQVTKLPAQDALQSADASEAQPLAPEASELPAGQEVNASDYLNPLVEQEWVVLDAEDKIHGVYAVLTPNGQERGLAGVTIGVGRNGVVIQSAVTEPDGRFTLNALNVGTYALVAKGPNTVAAFALHVLPDGASDRLDSNFTVVGTSVAGPGVGEIFRSHLVPGDAVPGYYPELPIDPYGAARRFNENATVQLSPQGVLLGHVSRPNGRSGADLSGNVVHILRAGQVVGHVATNARGDFQIAGFAPGIYDFVIAGKDGVAAGAFRAVAPAGVAQKGNASTQLVSTVNQPAQPDALNVELVAPIDWLAGEPEFVPVAEEPLAPVAGGGMVGPGGFGGFGGGGMGGGGGGAGGLGGMGGLLGIAGLAAGIAAAASNDNGFTIASPQ